MDKSQIEEQVKALIELEKHGKLIGEYTDIPEEVYHHKDCPGVSASGLVTVGERSYGHYLAEKENGSERTDAMRFGTAFHCLLLEPGKFGDNYVEELDIPKIDKRTKVGKEKYKLWEEEIYAPWLESHKGKEIIKSADMEKLMAMQKMAMSNTRMVNAMKGAEFENSYFWIDEKTGLLCKCRTDIINKPLHIVIDVKTALDASSVGFGRACRNFNYDVKAEFYMQGVETLFGGHWDYFFYACEKKPPYAAKSHHFYEDLRDHSTVGVRNWLSKFKASKEGRIERFYKQEIEPLNLPAYAFDTAERFGEYYDS